MSLTFKPASPAGQAMVGWHHDLQQDRGARARLRRCAGPEAVLMEPAFHRLLSRMRSVLGTGLDEAREEVLVRIARVAGLVAHVDRDDAVSLAQRLSESTRGGPLMKPLRMRRLLKTSSDELYPALVRAIRMLNRQASLSDLAETVYYWGDAQRRRWALAYFERITD